MGFFSQKCAKSKMSIPACGAAGISEAASHIVAITHNNKKIEGFYDGYGRVCDDDGATNVADLMSGGRVKFVRKDLYKGESFEELPESERCENQGYFYSEEEAALIEASLYNNARDFIIKE